MAKQGVKKGVPMRAPVESVQEMGEDSRQRRQEIPETGHLKDGRKMGTTGKLWLQQHDLSFTSSDSANSSVIAQQNREGCVSSFLKKVLLMYHVCGLSYLCICSIVTKFSRNHRDFMDHGAKYIYPMTPEKGFFFFLIYGT